jgi:hypothetical protein
MSFQEIMVLIHNGEYGRAISSLESEVSNESKPALERAEYCQWIAECHKRLQDSRASGDWYLEAIKRILSQKQVDNRTKAKQALPLCEKALESYKEDGDSADVLVAGRLKQYLLGLSK